MTFNTCLIGEDSLLIQCGNQLLARSHRIILVISPLTIIQSWARGANIPWIANIDALAKTALDEIDYLFSIVNSRILSSTLLQSLRVCAINYHDSLLPNYAGLNTTTWAIVNQETQHGVTWHVMNEQIDAGDIVKQVIVPINDQDTALTLNLRCFEQAISTFSALLDDLEAGQLTRQQQALAQRRYYSLSHQLPYYGFINWQQQDGETVERLARALTLGHYNNAVGTLKVWLGDDYVIVADVSFATMSANAHAPAGCLLAVESDALIIATRGRPLKIARFLSKLGAVIPLVELVRHYQLQVGYQLPSLALVNDTRFKRYFQLAKQSERYWVKHVKNSVEHNTFPTQSVRQQGGLTATGAVISLPDLFPHHNRESTTALLLTAVLIYLYRLNDYEPVSVSLVHPDYQQISQQWGQLFSRFLPLLFAPTPDDSLQAAMANVIDSLDEVAKKSVYFSDIAARYVDLEGSAIDTGMVVNLAGGQSDYHGQDNTLLYFDIDSEQGSLHVLHHVDLAYHAQALSRLIGNCTEHITTILRQLVTQPVCRIRDLYFLTGAEQHDLLQVWGKGTPCDLPGQSLTTLFAQQVAKYPDNIAIYCATQQITYQQLAALSDHVACYLHQLQVPPHALIGIYLPRSMTMLAVILGILKTNSTYVPLDTHYPLLKIEQIVEDTELAYVVTDTSLLTTLDDFLRQQGHTVHLLPVETVLNPAQTAASLPTCLTSEQALAYIMFTSGTTGRPKGVQVTHRNIINYCHWFTQTTQFNEQSIIDFSSSIAFDLSVPCTFAPLLVGGSIAIASVAEKTNPRHYLAHLQQHQVTHVELTPGYLEMLLNHPDEIQALTRLRYVLLGADVVPTSDVRKWLALCPNHQVINEYGPTETTVSATSYFVHHSTLPNDFSVPIGRPAFNSTCYVLDKYRNLCPAGMKGELFIGGAQVTQGYLNRPDLTQEKFVQATRVNPQERLYKTGDIVCWLPTGHLQFFGRNDHQVKIQGYRVELPAIESILLKAPGIHQAVVVAMTGKAKENYLRAYLVTDKKAQLGHELRAFVAAYLPHYMVPREFCVIGAIPLKDNEKIDFDALEKQNYQLLTFQPTMAIDHLTATQQVVKAIWEHVFHQSLPTIDDNFFDLGGDSLKALQIISDLNAHYSLTLPLQLLFECPTIVSLADTINSQLLTTTPILHHIKSPIVKLAEGCDKVPFFFIHPVGGSVFWYQPLARYLQGKYTVYGIQDSHLDGVSKRFTTLKDMAYFYLQEIKKIYPHGQYRLAGASFGATVAFEMAHQLVNTQQSLSFLGLFDGWAIYPTTLMAENTLDYLSQRDEKLQSLSYESRQTLNQLECYRKALLLDYQLTPLNAKVTLFKAAERWASFQAIDDDHNGWRPYVTGELVTHMVPGNHETIFFEPNVHVLAQYLRVV